MEPLKHECGVAMIRLLKPLQYYKDKYGTEQYGLNKLYLLMEKQHNRGQEGAGIACVRLNASPGDEYMFRERAAGTSAITEVFNKIHSHSSTDDSDSPDGDLSACEVYMGHLRYSTTGRSGLDFIHPFLRRNNWRVKNLALCGNFNMTNVDEIFQSIVVNGQHPRKYADTHIILEQVGHRLDREVERVYNECSAQGLEGLNLTHAIEDKVNIANVLRSSTKIWDGGYVMCGITGSGETFAVRDPWGIRPAFWYKDDEIVVLASERPVIQTVLNVHAEDIRELQPGQALMTHKNGEIHLEQINDPKQNSACSFERIYFSRGSDKDIYQERKEMGRKLVDQILPAINFDLEHTVFSYIPNTAEVAFYGLLEGLDNYLNQQKAQEIEALGHNPSPEELQKILSKRVRSEKVAIKDIKLRTFIAEGNSRNDLAAHVYDITYGSLVPFVDNLVVIDDSIVRGTTLKQSIIKILNRLHPKKIIIVSAAPQIRYPDYYGIDMSSVEQFIAFKAAIALLKDRNMSYIVEDVYEKVKKQLAEGIDENSENYVKQIYSQFTDQEVSKKIAELLKPSEVKTDVEIIFQTVQGLKESCPNNSGDWYFTGNYPTVGGHRMLNRAFVNFMEK